MQALFKKLALYVCILFPLSAAGNVNNDSITTNQYTFKDLGWNSAITLNGYDPTSTLYLPLSKKQNIQQIILHLTLVFSPKLSPESKLDIRFNQVKLANVDMPLDGAKETSIDIELPTTAIEGSWQALQLFALLKSMNDLCDPEVWIYISPKSSLSVTTLNRPFEGTLNQLPYPFVNSATLSPVSTQILLANDPDLANVFSTLQIAFLLGEKSGESRTDLQTNRIDAPAEELKKSNLIMIGTLPQVKTFLSPEALALPPNQGLLLLQASPFNPLNGLLILSGDNQEALNKSVSAFLTQEFKDLASGTMARVEEVATPKEPRKRSEFFEATFKELGYANKNVSGLGRHQLSFYIPLPNNRIPDRTQVQTFITTPLFKPQGFSQATLLVNNHKQASFWLNDEHSRWDTEIDSSFMKPGLNKLEYLIDLHFQDPKSEHCSRAYYDEVWATIHAQTNIKTGFLNSFPEASLNQLPVPFADEVSVILPNLINKEQINKLSQFFFKFGQLSKAYPLILHFRSAKEVDAAYIRDNNVIIWGKITDNPWINYALADMPVALKDKARYMNFDKKKLQVSGAANTGLLELTPSPWQENHAVMLITGDNDEGLFNATQALIDDKLRSQLNGNIAFINPDLSFTTLNSYENSYVSPSHRFMNALTHSGHNLYYYVINHPQVLIYLMAFLIPLFIVFRNRRK